MAMKRGPTIIDDFRGQHNFLSNFFPITIIVGGETYPSVEHAYQAHKAVRDGDHRAIRNALHPAIAKKMGKKIKIRPDWEEVKVRVMLDCLHAKFNDPELRRKLMSTEDDWLIEGNWWGDRFWGVCGGEGQNWLGELLMHVRWEIREGLI